MRTIEERLTEIITMLEGEVVKVDYERDREHFDNCYRLLASLKTLLEDFRYEGIAERTIRDKEVQ